MPITAAGDVPLLHPLHAILLAFPIAFFSGALVSDITYLNSAQIQWSNFAAWLIAAALLFGGLVLVWAIAVAVRHRRAGGRSPMLYPILLAAMWIIGLVNAFQHSQDGWSSVGTAGLLLSILSTLLALAAGWVGYSGVRRAGEQR